MITTGDARNILYKAFLKFGVEFCKEFSEKDIDITWNIPNGKVTKERIVVIEPKDESRGTYWDNCFVRVNICVPDPDKGEAALRRLDELQRLVKVRFEDWTLGTHDGTTYHYRAESVTKEEDATLECHYVYARINFEIKNVSKW